MSKPGTSYSDAMNEWAAKQSTLRKRRNRLLHPDPQKSGSRRTLGYALRIAILLAVLWFGGAKLTGNYYNGSAFNESLRSEIRALAGAEAVDAAEFSWQGSSASCEHLSLQGGDAAFFDRLVATQLSFELPLLKRLRRSWTIDQLLIGDLSLELSSRDPDLEPATDTIGAAVGRPPSLVAAGLLPPPDLSKVAISRVFCERADLSWGSSPGSLGGLEGTRVELFSGSPDWQLDLEGGMLRQNWLRGLSVEAMSVRRKGDQLLISDAEIRPGRSEEKGTLRGAVNLGTFPELALQLELPLVDSSDILPQHPDSPNYFDGLIKLSATLSGSIGSRTGIKISGAAMLARSGTFNKIPVLEAIDQLLQSKAFGKFSPDEGEIEFETREGLLQVTRFECRSRAASAILRGDFTYRPAITVTGDSGDPGADPVAANRPDQIDGKLQLGVRNSRLEENPVARQFFKRRAEGYTWIDIPLSGSLGEATRAQQADILAALRQEAP